MPANRWAAALFVFTVACAAAQAVLLGVAGVVPFSVEGVDEAFGIVTAATVCGAAVGAAIVTRDPANRIGWLFCVGEAGTGFGLAAQAAGVAVRRGAVDWPEALGHWASWWGQVFGSSFAFLLLAMLFLLVPDGRLPSRRWRWAAALACGSYLLVVGVVVVVGPGRIDRPEAEAGPVLGAAVAAEAGQIVAVAAALVALVARLRRAGGEERQQLRWIVAAAAVLTASLVAALLVGLGRGGGIGPEVVAVDVVLSIGFLGIPVATGFAVLRYRLYDIDVIIGSAVRLAVLAAFVTAGYVAVVVVAGRLAGGGGGPDGPAWPSLLAFVAVALAFQPVRRRARVLAGRVVYGERSAPYDALAAFSRRLGGSASEHDLLPRVARASGTLAGAARAEVELALPGGGAMTAAWPVSGAAGGSPVEIPVRHEGELLGRIRVTPAPGETLRRPQLRLLGDFATQTALALRNARLAAELRAREEELMRDGAELASSRGRLVGAGNAERERVAAAIRREVTDRLGPLPGRLALLERDVRTDPERGAAALGELRALTDEALEALRVITGGVFPALLVRRGLVAALEAFVDGSAGRVRLDAGPGSRGRFPPAVEAAAYFCGMQTAQDVEGPVHLTVTADEHDLTVSARIAADAANTGGPAVARVVDRIEAVGGRARWTRLDGGGARLDAVLPLHRPRPAAGNAGAGMVGP